MTLGLRALRLHAHPNRRSEWRALAGALILAIHGCVSSHQLGASCTLADSRATWMRTANAGRIEGEVRDLEAKGPIANLEIRIVDLERRQRTDEQGAFRFDSVPEGRHVLDAEGAAYQARVDTLIVLPDSGMRGALGLATRRDVLTRCPIYHP